LTRLRVVLVLRHRRDSLQTPITARYFQTDALTASHFVTILPPMARDAANHTPILLTSKRRFEKQIASLNAE
ncbi:MAG: hypothetical protein AAF394_04625, partial [Planctomycetota bacterium]